MLFTRCPHCRTTFRITAEALEKAGGHVRCGRCSSIFNAHDELREDLPGAEEQPAAGDTLASIGDGTAGTADDSGNADGESGSDAADVPDASGDGAQTAARENEADAGAAPSADDAATEEAGTANATAAPQTADDEWVASVLEYAPEAQPSETPAWSQAPAASGSKRRTALWTAASALALLALLAQGVHHYRGDLATLPEIGPPLQRVYGFLGLPLVPHWDVRQYRVLKWTAAAEPKSQSKGKGDLVITAQIRNQGPLSQPYPYIHLRLKNRWEDVVGSRTFDASEYLADAPAPGALMAAGATAQAKLAVVDPGPDAYGFDLDVCIKSERAKFRCADDDVFKQAHE